MRAGRDEGGETGPCPPQVPLRRRIRGMGRGAEGILWKGRCDASPRRRRLPAMGSSHAPFPDSRRDPPSTTTGGMVPTRGDDDGTVISAGRAAPPVLATTMEEIGRALEGHALGPYRLDRFVGGGGMGAVFRAVDTTLDRIVAVKVLSREHSSDDDMLRRFKNEAQLAARLDHENIGRVHAVGDDDGWHYIVFEFIEGTNLRDLVFAEGPLDVARALRFTAQVAEALEHAAGRGVVHRDIKPSNIIVTPLGRARLVDMGLARPTTAGAPDLTASGMTLGTFDYISPEQARDPRAADVRSDLYSLGCTLHFMLTGHPPFAEGTLVQKLLQHQQSEPPPVTAERPDVPDGLERIVLRLLEKRPEDRYRFPRDLIADLSAVADDAEIDLDVGRPAINERTVHERDAATWPWLVPVALLLAIVAGLILLTVARRARMKGGSGAAGTETVSGGADSDAVPAGRTWRIVSVPEAPDDVPTLVEALAIAGDGDTIECAFSGDEDTPPVAVGDRRITIRAAPGHEPRFRFVTGQGERARDAAITVASGRLKLDGVGARVTASSSGTVALFAVASGATLELVKVALETRSSRREGALPQGDTVFVHCGPDSAGGGTTRLRFTDVEAVGEGTFLVADPGVAVDLRWERGACLTEGRFLRLDGVPRGTTVAPVNLDLEDATFVCGEGFATLLDSTVGPGIPTLAVNALSCRFLVEPGRVFVEQAGIGTPEAYRSAVTWVDRGSVYEGRGTFRRIDGAAEREELPFPAADGRPDAEGPRLSPPSTKDAAAAIPVRSGGQDPVRNLDSGGILRV